MPDASFLDTQQGRPHAHPSSCAFPLAQPAPSTPRGSPHDAPIDAAQVRVIGAACRLFDIMEEGVLLVPLLSLPPAPLFLSSLPGRGPMAYRTRRSSEGKVVGLEGDGRGR